MEVDLIITNAITSNNVFKSLIDLSIGYYPQGGTLYASPIIASIIPVVFTNLQTASSFSFHLPACFFIYTCAISHKFILASLRKLLWFFPMVFDRKPIPSISELTSIQRLLYIKTNDPKIGPKWPCSFTNFVIPLPATYIRHCRDKCWNLLLKFECH